MQQALLWFAKRPVATFVFLLIGVGVFLRLFHFGQIPVSLYWDEMAIWDDAQSIATTGKDMFDRSAWQPIFISYGDFKLPVYIWLTSLVTFFVKQPLVGVRIVSLLAGLSMIPAVYLLSKQWGRSTQQSGIAAGLLAILPWSIHFSRVGFEAHLAAALIIWSLVCLFQVTAVNQKRWPRLLFAGLTFLLSIAAFYTYFSVRYVWPVLFGLAVLLWWKRFRKHGFLVGVLFIAWLAALIPMFRADYFAASNQLRLSTVNVMTQPDRVNQVNLWRQRAGNTTWSRVLYNQKTFLALDLACNMGPFFSAEYLFDTGDPNIRHGNGYTGLTWWTTAPLLLLGCIYLWKKDRRILLFLLGWWSVGILPAAVPLSVPHALRSLNAVAVMPLLAAAGLMWLIQLPHFKRRFLLGVVTVGLFFEISMYSIHYFSVYPRLSASDWQDGYLQLAQYLQTFPVEQPIAVRINDDRFFLYYLPYSHLTWSEIQKLPSESFKRLQVGSVGFEQDATRFSGTFVVLPATTAELPGKKAVKTIYGATGEPRFIVYE